MKRATNKKGTNGYGKWVDTFRKTLPMKAKDGHGKKHKRKLRKAETDFAVTQPTKIVSKFAKERSAEENSMESKKETMPNPVQTTSFFTKAVSGTPGYDEWLQKFREKMAAKHGNTAALTQKPSTNIGQSHAAILNAARSGDVNTMNHPDAHNMRDAQGLSVLHHLARNGKKEILTHPNVASTKDKLQKTPLHYLAEKNIPEILGHPEVANTFDSNGDTPLHLYSRNGNVDALTHPDVSAVKNFRGRTPLHSLAFGKVAEAKKHPDYDIVRDNQGRSPKDVFQGVSGLEPVEKGVKAFNKAFFGDLKKSDPIKKQYTFKGIPIKVEWPMGKVRKYGKNNEKDGEIMKADYGYIANTISPDGEEIDVYVGPNKKSDKIFLMLQKPTPYDVEHGMTEPEEKYMLGFDSIEEAEKCYKESMPPKWFKSIKEITYDDLHKKIKANTLTKDHELKKGYITRSELKAYVDKALSVTDGNNMEKLTEKNQPGTLGIPESFANNALDHSTTLDKSVIDAEEEGFRNAQENLKKDIETLPEASADQGNRERGPVYSFDENNSFQKGRTSKRLKIADKLDEIAKANAFVSNDGFVPRKEEALPANSFESKPFVSVKKALDKILEKSDMVSQGMLKYEKLNQIYRTKGRPDRLIEDSVSQNSEANKITKSLVLMQRTINRIPRLVFEI